MQVAASGCLADTTATMTDAPGNGKIEKFEQIAEVDVGLVAKFGVHELDES